MCHRDDFENCVENGVDKSVMVNVQMDVGYSREIQVPSPRLCTVEECKGGGRITTSCRLDACVMIFGLSHKC